jgi:hypothetical protein
MRVTVPSVVDRCEAERLPLSRRPSRGGFHDDQDRPEEPVRGQGDTAAQGRRGRGSFVPTYSGGLTLNVAVERDADGDWCVPADRDGARPRARGLRPEQVSDRPELISFINGISYFGLRAAC